MVARLKAEETVASAAMQAVRGRAENYRVDVGQVTSPPPDADVAFLTWCLYDWLCTVRFVRFKLPL